LKMKKKKYCKFCGKTLCKNCAKKKRPHPEKKDAEYQRICDGCDNKYVLKKILEEHNALLRKRKDQVTQREEAVQDLNKQLAEKQTINDNLRAEKSRRDSAQAKKVQDMTDDLSRINDQIKKIEGDNRKLTEETNKMHKEVQEVEKRLEETKKDFEVEQSNFNDVSMKLKAIDQDIAKMTNTIQKYEKEQSKRKAKKAEKGPERPDKSERSSLRESQPGQQAASMETRGNDSILERSNNNEIVVNSALLTKNTPGGESSPMNGDESEALNKAKKGSKRQPPQWKPNEKAKGSGSCDTCTIF